MYFIYMHSLAQRYENCDSLTHAFVWEVCAVNKHVFQVHINLYM